MVVCKEGGTGTEGRVWNICTLGGLFPLPSLTFPPSYFLLHQGDLLAKIVRERKILWREGAERKRENEVGLDGFDVKIRNEEGKVLV